MPTTLETLDRAEKHLESVHDRYKAAEIARVEAARTAFELGQDYRAAVRLYRLALETYREENSLA